MRPLLVLLLLPLAACQDRTCPEGQLRTHLGECVSFSGERSKAPMPEGGESLPPCERLPVGTELDLINGCVEGACVNQTLAELEASFGEPGNCTNVGLGSVYCGFRGDTVYANFDDDNNDGYPDDPTEEAFGIYVEDGYGGSSASGLGVGVSLRCFLEDFIAINDVELNLVGDTEQIVQVFFDNPSLFVYDVFVFGEFDGYVSRVSMYGP